MSNIDRHPECHMRTALGNCNPLGGFCTSVNEPICEALHKVSRPQGEWIVSDDKYFHTCQFCNAEVDVSMGTGIFVNNDEVSHMNFCPNCGARMRPKLQGKHFDSIIIDESAMKGADDE